MTTACHPCEVAAATESKDLLFHFSHHHDGAHTTTRCHPERRAPRGVEGSVVDFRDLPRHLTCPPPRSLPETSTFQKQPQSAHQFPPHGCHPERRASRGVEGPIVNFLRQHQQLRTDSLTSPPAPFFWRGRAEGNWPHRRWRTSRRQLAPPQVAGMPKAIGPTAGGGHAEGN